jgi:hypothetical protein
MQMDHQNTDVRPKRRTGLQPLWRWRGKLASAARTDTFDAVWGSSTPTEISVEEIRKLIDYRRKPLQKNRLTDFWWLV